MSAPRILAQLCDRYLAAWAAHDPDAIAALHTDDTTFWLHHGQDIVVGAQDLPVPRYIEGGEIGFSEATVSASTGGANGDARNISDQ